MLTQWLEQHLQWAERALDLSVVIGVEHIWFFYNDAQLRRNRRVYWPTFPPLPPLLQEALPKHWIFSNQSNRPISVQALDQKYFELILVTRCSAAMFFDHSRNHWPSTRTIDRYYTDCRVGSDLTRCIYWSTANEEHRSLATQNQILCLTISWISLQYLMHVPRMPTCIYTYTDVGWKEMKKQSHVFWLLLFALVLSSPM